MNTGSERLSALLSRNMGVLAELLADPDVLHISVTPAGSIFVERFGQVPAQHALQLSVAERASIIRLVSTNAGQCTTETSCRLATILPDGERFQGFVPPSVAAPAFEIRRRPARIYTLEDYVSAGMLTSQQFYALHASVASHDNIVVSAGTGAGKSTLLNALIDTLHATSEHLVTIEDTPELQVRAPYWTALYTVPGQSTMAHAVADALRCNPSRIIVGEVRGPEALDVLDAWGTGHHGMLTLHADPGKTGARLESLLRRAPLTVSLPIEEIRGIIANAVHIVVEMTRTVGVPGRCVSNVTRWHGLGTHTHYLTERIA